MKPLIYLFTAAVLFGATSCKKETVEQLPSIEKDLMGKWKFERTRLGTGVVYVAVPGEVDMIDFKIDRVYQRSTNGVNGAQGTYELTQPISIFSGKKDNAITLRPQQDIPNIVRITKDSLYLAQNVYDGSTSIFSRVK
ncbi:MAG: hypothetical protein V4619_07400 [Bacteroidota bacterium]